MNDKISIGDILLKAVERQGDIEGQEKEGQALMAASSKLPKECPKEELEKLGFLFEGEADNLFYHVQMPNGWSVVQTEHSMWSDLVDGKGQKRGGIFYKAAFYDRKAHMSLHRRYKTSRNFDLEDDQTQFHILDGDNAIYSTEIRTSNKHSDDYWACLEELQREVDLEIEKRFPDHLNTLAYWE